MKNKPINIQVMNNAINEYLSSNLTYIEICHKYDIRSYTFFYHLKKFRTNPLTGGGNVSNENLSNVNISALNGNKIVDINTNSKKMQEYIKQHSMSEHSIHGSSDNTVQSNLQLETKRKKAPQRITDVDALFDSIKI